MLNRRKSIFVQSPERESDSEEGARKTEDPGNSGSKELKDQEETPSTFSNGSLSRFNRQATNEEAKKYDFAKVRESPTRKTISVSEAIGHLLKSCLGGGIVTLHEAVKDCGIWAAIVFHFLLGAAIAYCMLMLARSAQVLYGRLQTPSLTYPDLAEASLGIGPWPCLRRFKKVFRYSVDVLICSGLFLACSIYQVLVGKTIKQLVDQTDGRVVDTISPRLWVYVLVLLVPLVLLCMITSLKYLAPFSMVADMFIFMIALATVYYGLKSAEKTVWELPVFFSFFGSVEFIGCCIFSLQGIGTTLAIENNMTEPKKMDVVIYGGMAIVTITTGLVAFFGYFGFGKNSDFPITINFPIKPFPIMLKAFMSVVMFLIYALNFWMPFQLLWYYMKRNHGYDSHHMWERIYRVIFVVFITGFSFLCPNIHILTGLIGCFCLSILGFVYPAIIELSVVWEDPGLGKMKWRLLKAVGIMLVGMLIFSVGSVHQIMVLLDNFSKGEY